MENDNQRRDAAGDEHAMERERKSRVRDERAKEIANREARRKSEQMKTDAQRKAETKKAEERRVAETRRREEQKRAERWSSVSDILRQRHDCRSQP
jgi:hypothetical protein